MVNYKTKTMEVRGTNGLIEWRRYYIQTHGPGSIYNPVCNNGEIVHWMLGDEIPWIVKTQMSE